MLPGGDHKSSMFDIARHALACLVRDSAYVKAGKAGAGAAMQGLFTLCAVAYLLIYACEGAIRYGLYSVGADSAILLRDGLIIGPLLLLLAAQGFRTREHPAFF